MLIRFVQAIFGFSYVTGFLGLLVKSANIIKGRWVHIPGMQFSIFYLPSDKRERGGGGRGRGWGGGKLQILKERNCSSSEIRLCNFLFRRSTSPRKQTGSHKLNLFQFIKVAKIMEVYSPTCVKQAPKGQSNSACLRQVLA